MLTVVTPAYNEALNLPVLYSRLSAVLAEQKVEWEWVVVDDHSRDDTFAVLCDLASRDSRVRGVRFSRNFGAHTAVTCGLHQARGECAVILAADLQDPPETIPALLAEWKDGAHVVWAVRAVHRRQSLADALFAKAYYALTRRIEGLRNRPEGGMDFGLLDRRVVEAFSRFRESHVSILSLIAWMGFRQASVPYTKEARLHGRSGWSLARKLKLALDSIIAFSYAPIRIMSYVGFVTASLGFLFALFVFIRALVGTPPEGYASVMVVLLVTGGIQMIMMGVLGEYLWRTLDEVRERPRYIIEATAGDKTSRVDTAVPPS